ncbi:hypothetical protein [Hugenholtzia roseola]|uniref:hypothetical protein n=1 Tax=Hugenholtzia roseola TaxID=1002 RepID=UPI0003F74F9E|nr:hypothetical protein [Hugenholtzia roseola]
MHEDLQFFWQRLLEDRQLAFYMGGLTLCLILLLVLFVKVLLTPSPQTRSENLTQNFLATTLSDDFLRNLEKITHQARTALQDLEEKANEQNQLIEAQTEKLEQLQAALLAEGASEAQVLEAKKPFRFPWLVFVGGIVLGAGLGVGGVLFYFYW